MGLAMTRQERERFLADLHVGIVSIPEEGRGPLTVPVWYTYIPGGELQLVTGRASRKGRLLERAGRFSLCVQREIPPYKYVSVEGPIVAIDSADLDRDLRPFAHRYLGAEAGEAYITTTREEHLDNARSHASGALADRRLREDGRIVMTVRRRTPRASG